MKKKVMIPVIILIVFIAILTPILIIVCLFGGNPDIQDAGERKAMILCSANDFYPTEADDDFNSGAESNFSSDTGRWVANFTNGYGGVDSVPGKDGNLGAMHLIANTVPEPNGTVSFELTYNWTKYHTLYEFAYYNLSAWVNIPTSVGLPGARVGLRWLNQLNIVRTDWSEGKLTTGGQWELISVSGVCNNASNNLISQLQLVLAVQGMMNHNEQIFYDDVKIDHWIAVNVSNPIDPNPPPSSVDSDGFPAQSLHVYWILKDHGYTDDNIFLMLYHKNDPIIDIKAGDGIANDLIGAIIDVEDDDVNASRFKQELNVSKVGSFASQIDSKDQMIIFMTDHGSNGVLLDGNATFHFETDNSYITEFEFYDLVKLIDCERMMINIDACFSGNFLNQNMNIGNSWYNLPKCLLISSSSNVFSWYWSNNKNGDGFAGSWFFHQFWEQLDQNQTVNFAFNFAINFIPFGRGLPLIINQRPLMHDSLGINAIWSFISDPPL